MDRFGARAVVIPGVSLLALASWQLTAVALDSPFGALQALFVLRGLGLGLIIQPLLVAALSTIPPAKFAQASSLYTVIRFVSTTLGIAVLATLVQSRAAVHAARLAAPVVRASLPGTVTGLFQPLLILSDASPTTVRLAALARGAPAVQRLGTVLAIQDAFWVVLVVLIVSLVAAGFVRTGPVLPSASSDGATAAPGKVARREAIVIE